MNRYVLGILSTLAFLAIAQPVHSGDLVASGRAAKEYGQTLPPVGFVKFCVSHPEDCRPYSVFEQMELERPSMSQDRWKLVHQINRFVNDTVARVSDDALYGEEEHWAYPLDAGDCEDNLLLKKRTLEEQDFPRTVLRITVVLDERREGHAVLTIVTNEGDFILDNRRDVILYWKDTNYTFLKRQGPDNPTHWVALRKELPTVTATGNK